MTLTVMVSIALFTLSIIFNLISYVVTNLFVKKMDQLLVSFDKMAEKLEHYVKVQDHKDDLNELRKRMDRLEDRANDHKDTK